MVWTIIEDIELVWLAIQTRIGKDVSVTGKALKGVASDWDQQLALGSVGSRSQWL